MLKFARPLPEEKELLSFLCKDNIRGTEAFTILNIYENIPEEAFWCGRTDTGETESLVFNNGDRDIKIIGKEFSDLFLFPDGCIMVYNGNSRCKSCAEDVTGSKLLDFYRLISSEEVLSYDNEKRYVERLRAVNKGFARVFCIYDKEKPVSSAAVTAMNEKYALIGDVFTKKEFRNRRLSSLCLESALSYALSREKIPVLYCSESMCGFYEKAGFSYYGKM